MLWGEHTLLWLYLKPLHCSYQMLGRLLASRDTAIADWQMAQLPHVYKYCISIWIGGCNTGMHLTNRNCIISCVGPQQQIKMSPMKSWEDVRDVLRIWREDNVRRSDEVVEHWENVLCRHSHKLKDELWMVYEQVFIAAVDCHRMDIAKECVDALNVQFPKSLRVRNLTAMQFEAIERYEDAIKLYDSIIAQDESNLLARKRKVAILKSQNKIPEAIKELVEYLKKFMSDQEAWMELSDLYIMEQDFNKAAFCIEELILFSPHNHLFHQRYAEIRYTQGGIENMEVARAYFAQAVKLNPNNIRALYGICLCTSNIASSPKCPAPKKKENVKFRSWALAQLPEKYAKKMDEDDLLFQSMLCLLTSLHLVT